MAYSGGSFLRAPLSTLPHLLYPRGPGIGSHFGHMGKAGLVEAIPQDGVPDAFRRILGPLIGRFITFDVREAGDPS